MNILIEEPQSRIATHHHVEMRQGEVPKRNNGDGNVETAYIKRRRPSNLIILTGLILAGVATAFYHPHFLTPYESTDDAFIEGHVNVVAPQVSGRLVRLLVEENQVVKRGDMLLEIASDDYQNRMDEQLANLVLANSRLEQAKAQVLVDQAKANEGRANVRSAVTEVIRAKADLQRYLDLESGAMSRSEFETAEAQYNSAMAQLGLCLNRVLGAEAQVKVSQTGIEMARAQVLQCDAAFSQARLDLSRTKVVAPTDGRVMKCSVKEGAYLNHGEAVMSIVPDEFWVVANFKKTQLAYMRPGQPVDVKLSAYPERKLKGHVDRIQEGMDAQFSMSSPEQATGNSVKSLQRVPVKIVFDEPIDPTLAFGPGMSVEAQVKVK